MRNKELTGADFLRDLLSNLEKPSDRAEARRQKKDADRKAYFDENPGPDVLTDIARNPMEGR